MFSRIRGGRLDPRRAGFSIAVGLYIGVQPVFGLHLPLCLAICIPLRLDALVAYAAANISNPLLAAFIVFSEVQLGSLVLDAKLLPLTLAQAKHLEVAHLLAQVAVGAQLLGLGLAIFGGVVAARVARFARARAERQGSTEGARTLSNAVARTIGRYATVRAADRHYVSCKLRWDPITRVVSELPIEWGSVLDVGCGRGQLGLLLVELGRVRELRGFDWDQDKIKTANQAASGAARFELGDLADAELASCNTVLLIDVLHYLPYDAQLQLLEQVRARLLTGGTLVLRDVDARRTWRSRLTQWFEIIGTRLGVNRGRRMYFLASADLHANLEQVGFTVTDTIAMPGLTLDNVLVVARNGGNPAPLNHEGGSGGI